MRLSAMCIHGSLTVVNVSLVGGAATLSLLLIPLLIGFRDPAYLLLGVSLSVGYLIEVVQWVRRNSEEFQALVNNMYPLLHVLMFGVLLVTVTGVAFTLTSYSLTMAVVLGAGLLSVLVAIGLGSAVLLTSIVVVESLARFEDEDVVVLLSGIDIWHPTA